MITDSRLRDGFAAVLLLFAFGITPPGTCWSDELSPILPERISSSRNMSYCLRRYRDALSAEDGAVLYVCAVGKDPRSARRRAGIAVSVDLPDGSIRYYHALDDADVVPGDKILYVVSEPHPPWAWCYNGVEQSLVLVGYRKYGHRMPGALVRIYDGQGRLRDDFSNRVSQHVTLHLQDAESDDPIGVRGAWVIEGEQRLFLADWRGICLEVSLDSGTVEQVPLATALEAGLSTPSSQQSALEFLVARDTRDMQFSRAQLACIANDRTESGIARTSAALVLANEGNEAGRETLVEFSVSVDAELREYANAGLDILEASK